MIWGQVGVFHGHRQSSVTEQFLNGFNVHSSPDKVGGKGMASIVKAEVLNSRSIDRRMELLLAVYPSGPRSR